MKQTTLTEEKPLKWTLTRFPPGGWGVGSNEPNQALFTFYNDEKENALCSANRDPKPYNNMKN